MRLPLSQTTQLKLHLQLPREPIRYLMVDKVPQTVQYVKFCGTQMYNQKVYAT